MAKGFEQNQEHKRALHALGKDLARRARSKCELSHARGVPLVTYEIPPIPEYPELDRCLLVSQPVFEQLTKTPKFRPDEWRHLNDLVWSDHPGTQVMALRVLRFLAPNHPWAQQILEDVYPEPEIDEWAEASPLA